MEEKKKLYRIEEGKKIAGVCNGIAEYFGIDVTIIRIAWILAVFFAGCGIVAYIIAALVMPKKEA